MEQKDKELLLKDLCARLPYGVKVKIGDIHILKLGTHTRVGEYVTDIIEPCKPYLFPLSSMTDKQYHEFLSTCNGYCDYYWTEETFDWFNKNHFDYRGLIEKGLAIDCIGLNIY